MNSPLPGDETESIGELEGKKGLCAGTLITLLASEAASLLNTSASQAAEAVITI